jgi:hypothetical protein
MKFAAERPYSDLEKAARKLIEIANSVEPVQDGRIYIELINAPFLYEAKASLTNTWPPSSWRYVAAGYGWTVPEPMLNSPKQARSCSSRSGGEVKMTDSNTDLDALVQETMAIAKSIRVEPPISERGEIRQRVANFKAYQERLAREREDFATSLLNRMLGRS